MIAQLRALFSRKFVQDTLVLQVGKVGLLLLSLISSVIVWRILGPERSGEIALAQSFLVIWQTLDLTGVGTSTATRLSIAIGANDDSAILDLMAFYVKVNAAVNIAICVLIALLGTAVAGLVYNGNTRIVALAFWLAVGYIADGLYGLVMIALRSRRSMRALALMQNANQLVLTASVIVAILINPTSESVIAGRVFYSYATLLLAFAVYQTQRARGQVHYPPLRAIFARARTISPRPYWRFGVANAIDKNIAELFISIPIQLVGIFAGARAVGYLNLALSGITQASIFTSAVLDNMQAVVPQAIGRRDYAGLWRNFTRVLVVMALLSLGLYGALVLVAPLLIPPVLGTRWIPAIPPLAALALYGAVTTVGGNFSPLYRAFDLMRRAILVKLVALVTVMPVGFVLLQTLTAGQAETLHFLGVEMVVPGNLAVAGMGAVAGAWMINGVLTISIILTALVTLPILRNKARQ